MTTVRATIQAARSALLAGDADLATGACSSILERYPKHLEASCLLAEARRELRQLPEALDLFERVIAADPESLIGHWAVSTILEEQGDLPGALYELQCAWDTSPGHRAVRGELMRLRAANGQSELEPELSPVGLARVYWRGFQDRRAVQELRRALAEGPERLDARVLLAECLWRLGRAADAAEIAAEVLVESPDCLKANLIRGYARFAAGGRAADEGRKLLGRALALDPECGVAASLFPDGALPLPLVAEELPLDAPPPALVSAEVELPVDATVESAPHPAPRGSILAAAFGVEMAAPSLQATAGDAPQIGSAIAQAQPIAQPANEVPPEWSPELILTEAAPDDATPLADDGVTAPAEILEPMAAPEVEAEDPAAIAEPEPVDEPVTAAEVPAWLARDESSEAPKAGGLDPTLYSEWADLLGEEVELDADAAARLEEALSEATGAGATSAGWREVALAHADVLETVASGSSASDTEHAPVESGGEDELLPTIARGADARTVLHAVGQGPALGEMNSRPDLDQQLAELAALAAIGQIDEAAEGYRTLLRARAEAASPAIEALALLIVSHPDSASLHRALGDAYMRAGRFQKAIEEYNRAVATQPRAVVAA